MTRSKLLLSAAFLLLLCFNSCKKITEDYLINGLWQVTEVNINGSSVNYLDSLPHYTTGNDCCAYKLDFERDNTVIAYYIAHDNFERIEAGNYKVTDYNEVFIKVDNFIDGTFEITQPSIKKRVLTSDANHIEAYDGTALDTTATVIKMQKY